MVHRCPSTINIMEMAMPDGSNRNPFIAPDQLTLLDVLGRIEQDAGLSLQRRRNLRASIRTLGKLTGRDLAFLPAHPGFYRELFKDLHPEHCGLTMS